MPRLIQRLFAALAICLTTAVPLAHAQSAPSSDAPAPRLAPSASATEWGNAGASPPNGVCTPRINTLWVTYPTRKSAETTAAVSMAARCACCRFSLIRTKPVLISTVAVAFSAALSVGMSETVMAVSRGGYARRGLTEAAKSRRGSQFEEHAVADEQHQQQRQVGDRD